MLPILEVRNLTKHYALNRRHRTAGESSFVKAVDGIGFSIRSGSCFGLLGPNGAGKTTTLEVIEGITEPNGGEIFFQGKPVLENGKKTSLYAELRQKTGIQFQSTALLRSWA